ncbi:MAG: hypothetical protein P0Y52_02340 [Candidatus Brevundimonas phytovorans]|jgi:hypothetical protein|nr:hypothetical protein [Brevundimonas sp.]WEK58398.1 MAG: hypothetical protein P0Y52_02340 [Brevundimonas sp.]
MSASNDPSASTSEPRRKSASGLPNWVLFVLIAAVVVILGLLVAGATGG